jgi:predicted transcriptional regulator
MSKTAVITARVDEETLALVDRVSKAHNRSRGWFAAQAIAAAARKEAEFLAFVQEGIDAADRGELVSHEEVMADLDAAIAKYQALCDR